MHFKKSVVVAAATAAPILAHYTKNYKVNTYFGQANNYMLDVDTLGQYCESDSIDYVTLAFVNNSPENANGYPGTNFGSHCAAFVYKNDKSEPTQLLSECTFIRSDIKKCQDLGKKVFLSIGGEKTSTSNYAVSSIQAGEDFAQQMFDFFGPFNENFKGPRPFGNLAVDGFDFDIEFKFENQEPYVHMINKLRSLIQESKADIILSAAPQCPLDNQYFQMDTILAQAQFDKIFIQFYNNPGCAATNPATFNYNKWVKWLEDKPSKDAELYIGLPGSKRAAGSGYINPVEATNLICSYKSSKNFGGVMLWDAYYAYHNEDSVDETYYDVVKRALTCGGCSGDICAPETSSSSSSTASSTSSSTALTSSTSTAAVTTSSDVISSTASSAAVTTSSSSSDVVSSTASSADASTSSSSAVSTASASSQSETASSAVSSSQSVKSASTTVESSTITASVSVSASASASQTASSTTIDEDDDECAEDSTSFSYSSTAGASQTTSSGAITTGSSSGVVSSATNSGSASIKLPTSSVPSASATGSVSVPVTTASSSGGYPVSTPTQWTTSTVYTTKVHTVTSCAPSVTGCPASLTTETIALYTTICPVSGGQDQPTKPAGGNYPAVPTYPAGGKGGDNGENHGKPTDGNNGGYPARPGSENGSKPPAGPDSENGSKPPAAATYPTGSGSGSGSENGIKPPAAATYPAGGHGGEADKPAASYQAAGYAVETPSVKTTMVPVYPTAKNNGTATVAPTGTGLTSLYPVVPKPTPSSCSGPGCGDSPQTTPPPVTAGSAKTALFSLGSLFIAAVYLL